MADRKPITRSFPPDPRRMPDGQVPPFPSSSPAPRCARLCDGTATPSGQTAALRLN